MTDDGGDAAYDENAATGRIRDVVYAGMFTRYVVDLDDGGELARRPPEPRDVFDRGAGRPRSPGAP